MTIAPSNDQPPKPRYLSPAKRKKLEQEERIAKLVAHIDIGRDAGCTKEQMQNLLSAGLVMTDKQFLFCAAARSCDLSGGPTAVAYGGARGGGKTFCVLAQAGADDCQRYPGLKVLFLRKVGKSNKEQFEDFRKKVFAALPHEYKAQEGRLEFKNGSWIKVGHFKDEKDIDNYLGLEYDLIIIEEATTLTYSKYKNILTCLRTSKPGWRPRVYLSTNPGNIGHAWFKQEFILPARLKKEQGSRFIPATVRDNPHVNMEYTGVLESLSGWQRAAWLDGDWDIQAGQFFTTWREKVHVLPTIDERKIVRFFGALDYGFGHYTVFHLGGEDKDGNMYVLETHRARQMTVFQHSQAIHGMLERRNMSISDLDYCVTGKDCFHRDEDGQTIAKQYDDLGIPLTAAEVDRVNGWSEVLRRLGDADNGVKPTLYIHSRCVSLIEQFPVMQHDPIRPEDIEKVDCDEEGRGGDDDMDCLRYMVASNPVAVLRFAKPVQMGRYLGYKIRGC